MNIFNLKRVKIIIKNINVSNIVKIKGYYYRAKHKMQIIKLSFNINHLTIITL